MRFFLNIYKKGKHFCALVSLQFKLLVTGIVKKTFYCSLCLKNGNEISMKVKTLKVQVDWVLCVSVFLKRFKFLCPNVLYQLKVIDSGRKVK